MSAPQSVLDLISRYAANRAQYENPAYSEASARQEFINPLLEALGWDVANKGGAAEAYKPVVVESELSGARRPDYALRFGGVVKIYIEAKKPAADLRDHAEAALQLRSYGWSGAASAGILTNFRQLAIYDCRGRPRANEPASRGRLRFCEICDEAQSWDFLCSVFSPEAIRKGDFDRFVGEAKSARGAARVDDAFLGEMEKWRKALAANIALRNADLNGADLNFAVQRILDRIVFLRIGEDRGLERYARLRDLAAGGGVYGRLMACFHDADARYNAGLFHFRRERGRAAESVDAVTPRLRIDDSVLQNIVADLYPPKSPYAFSVIGADILGQIYERFLGSEIRLTAGHRARVEQKPAVRHAGGVYYTPAWVADYIVARTAGALCEGKTLAQAARLRILDPACGSGSFLLSAYRFLLDWHLRRYAADPAPHLKAGRILRADGGDVRLTVAERRRILTNHIYGADIDPQAVEVAKLSLLLKCLEGETAATLRMLPGVRALPDLAANIKCGNSLVASDFYAQGELAPAGARRINAFDWRSEFPQIVGGEGGFDCVVGNPPYVRQEILGAAFKEYARRKFKAYHGAADLYAYFIERGLSLLKPGGRFSFIVANKWLRAGYGRPLRDFLRGRELLEIADFGDLPVFKGASAYPCILTVGGGAARASFAAAHVGDLNFDDLEKHLAPRRFAVMQSKLAPQGWALIGKDAQKLIERMRAENIPLGEYVGGKFYFGIKTGLNDAFIIDDSEKHRLISADANSAELIKPFARGRDIKRYQPLPQGGHLILIPKGFTNAHKTGRKSWGWFEQAYPAIAAHLAPFEQQARKRTDQGDYWWELRACDYYAEFEKPKIVLPDISATMNFAHDQDGFYCANTAYIISLSPDSDDGAYLLAVLNSNAAEFFYRNLAAVYRGGYMRFFAQYLAQIPIPRLDPKNRADQKRREKIAALSRQITSLQKTLQTARTPHDKTTTTRQITAADKALNAEINLLYRLSEKETALIGGAR